MDAKETGIALTRGELRALREFGSQGETNRDFFGVHFETVEQRVWARSTDSRRVVIFDGISDGTLGNREWFVDMKFLIDGRKELEGKQVLRLNFSGASLHAATIEENGVGRLTIERERDAAIAQVSLPKIAKDLTIPGARREKLHCITLAAGHLKAVKLASEAVEEEMVEWFAPSTPDGLLVFRIAHDKDTSCHGGFLLNLSAESILRPGDKEDDEDEEGDEAPKGRKRNRRQQDLPTNANGADASAE